MSKVRTHTVHGPSGTYTRHQHDRKIPRARGSRRQLFTLQPRRAWRNAGKANAAVKDRRLVVGGLLATFAVSELLGWFVFRVGGIVLMAVGLVCVALAYDMKRRT